uniref:TIR domain-containing protein n=1 Tax=Sphaeramia orbicularis TaxID=375764 RepID=A0A673ALA5_9TELE
MSLFCLINKNSTSELPKYPHLHIPRHRFISSFLSLHVCPLQLENFTLLPNETQYELWIPKATKKDEGVYVCVCTWTHNHLQYTSTAARGLLVPGESILRIIITTEDLSQNVIATETLTIERVSPEDFVEFRCVGERLFESTSYTVTLKRRGQPLFPGSQITLMMVLRVCVFSLCVFAAVIVKCFAIDLALIFRRYLPFRRAENSAMTFDAYVVYQLQSEDKDTEDTLCHFVTKVLPEVLEEKCGYRLFIHGRDDIPGEDRLELVEDRMKKSRRLIVILTPGSGSGYFYLCVISTFCLFNKRHEHVLMLFQVGLHHALVQREMTVILIQLGDTGPQGYTHLPPGLQHLIQKSDPLRWPQNSRGAASSNSRFWKRVRYLMPATPAKKFSFNSFLEQVC